MPGVLSARRGGEVELAHQSVATPATHAALHHPEHESSSYRYCTNFAVTGHGMAGHSIVEQLERIGDSVLVVGDEQTVRVHVHTDDPGLATALFAGAGEVSRLDVADMHVQIAERDERLA